MKLQLLVPGIAPLESFLTGTALLAFQWKGRVTPTPGRRTSTTSTAWSITARTSWNAGGYSCWHTLEKQGLILDFVRSTLK